MTRMQTMTMRRTRVRLASDVWPTGDCREPERKRPKRMRLRLARLSIAAASLLASWMKAKDARSQLIVVEPIERVVEAGLVLRCPERVVPEALGAEEAIVRSTGTSLAFLEAG